MIQSINTIPQRTRAKRQTGITLTLPRAVSAHTHAHTRKKTNTRKRRNCKRISWQMCIRTNVYTQA